MTNNDKQETKAQESRQNPEEVQSSQSHGEDVVEQGELNADEILEGSILFALDEAAEELEATGELEPFIVILQGEELFVEKLPSSSEEVSYAAARRSVYQMEKICNAYVFCYDGYVELDEGTSDALITEFANKGDEQAQVIVRLYTNDDDKLEIEEELYHVGDADTLFGYGPKDWEGILSEDDE